MPTPSRGIRVTRRRAEELETLIEVNAARVNTRIDELARRLTELERVGTLGEALARARVASELTVLQGIKGGNDDH